MFPTDSESVYDILKALDDNPAWPADASATVVIVGGAALAFYNVRTVRATDDVDGIVLAASIPPDRLQAMAEAIGVSFRAGAVMWIPDDWDTRIQWSSWEFRHLRVGWLDPYDWIITKLGRWLGHDPDDVVAVASRLDPAILRDRVRSALPDYVGDPRRVRMHWNDLVDRMGWPETLHDL